MPDLNANDIEAASKIIAGTARSDGHHGRGLTGGSSRRSCTAKAYRAAAAKIEAGQVLRPPPRPSRLAKETGSAKFDSTVEVALKLAVDPRKADQMVRGTVILPHGTGKTARVIVFATGPAGRGRDRRRCRRGRRRRAHREGRRRLDRVRRGRLDARAHGPGRSSR